LLPFCPLFSFFFFHSSYFHLPTWFLSPLLYLKQIILPSSSYKSCFPFEETALFREMVHSELPSPYSTLKTEAAGYDDMGTYQTTWCHIPEDLYIFCNTP
jgi:hypothetical protein